MRSIWSYAGLGVALLVAALLIVPGFLDWSRYAGLIETQAEALTGRDVEIAGDVRISILPSPTLTLGKMTIANTPGASGPHMLEINSMTAELSVASLFRGDLEISRLTLDAPTLWLEETPDGRSNWQFAGMASADDADALDEDDGLVTLPPLRVGEIALSSGRIAFRNIGIGTDFEISGIDALIGAESLIGPYRAKGTARLGAQDADFVATLGEVSSDKAYPAKVSFTFKNAEAAFQGIVTGRGADLRFDGALSAGAAADMTPVFGALTAGQPLSLTAGVVAASGGITLRDIEAEAGAIKVTGNIAATSGPSFTVDVGLTANRVDFSGFDTAGIPIDGAAIEAAIGQVIGETPAGTYVLAAEEIWLPEGKVLNASLAAESGGGTISISSLGMRLPGGTDLSATGALSSGEEGPYFSGDIELAGADGSATAAWLGGGTLPHGLSAMPLRDFSGKSSVFLTPRRIGLDRLEMMIDGNRITGQVSSTFETRPTIAARLTADALALPAGGLPLADRLVPGRAIDLGFDGEVALDVARLDAGRVHVEKVSMDLAADGPDVTLRELLFETALGAKATFSGGSTAADGRYQATLSAPNVASLEGLISVPSSPSLAQLEPLSVSAQAAWPTDIVLDSAVGGAAETVALSMLGRVDTVRIEIEGEMAPGYDGLADAAYDITSAFESDQWHSLAGLAGAVFGVTGEAPTAAASGAASDGPQTITAAFQGIRGKPMVLAAEADLDVFRGTIAGQVGTAAADMTMKLALKGDVSDPVLLAAALGRPLQGISTVRYEGDVSLAGDIYTFNAGSVRIAGDDGVLDAGLSGHISFGPSPPSGALSMVARQVDLELVSGLLTGAYVTPADAEADAGDDAVADGDKDAWSTGLLDTGWLNAAVLDINLTGGGVAVAGMHADQLALVGSLKNGRLTIGEARGNVFGGELRGSGFLAAESGLTLEADVAVREFDAGEAVGVLGFGDFVTGSADIDMSIKGSGLSALALVSSLAGQGSFAARDGTLVGLDVAALATGLSQLERVEDFEPLADSSLTDGVTAYERLEGKLTMTAGVLRAPEIGMEMDVARGRTAAFADFGRRALDVEIGIDLKKPAKAPEALIVFAGDFAAPARVVNTVDLEAFMARRLLNQEIDALGVEAPQELRVILDLPDQDAPEQATP